MMIKNKQTRVYCCYSMEDMHLYLSKIQPSPLLSIINNSNFFSAF